MILKFLTLLSIFIYPLYATDIEDTLYSKPTLTKKQIEKKRDGLYITGLPLLNFDADKGFGYGVRVFLYNNGSKNDKLFKYTPYRDKLYIQYFQTTNGYSKHKIYYDSPYIGDSLFRLTGEIAYEKNTHANYFGTTASSLNNLTDTLGNSFITAQKQQEALDKQGSPYYNRYLLVKPKTEINLARDFFGGLVRLSLGINIEYTTISDYNNSVEEENEFSKLSQEQNEISGYCGGWDNGIKFSIVYDSRDFAPNPKNGSVHDFTITLYDKIVGSDFSHQRYTLSSSNFFTPKNLDYLTLAARGVYSVQTGDTPFFNQNTLNFSDDSATGLGGQETLRGYAQDRFVADVKVLGNFEARLHFYENHILGQSFEFMVVPFVDVAKVFDSVNQTDLTNYKQTYGMGIHTAWNQATIILVDYGKSVEDSGLYINFGHIF